jgi:hypothetical protein
MNRRGGVLFMALLGSGGRDGFAFEFHPMERDRLLVQVAAANYEILGEFDSRQKADAAIEWALATKKDAG